MAMTSSDSAVQGTDIGTPDELREWARSMIPVVRERGRQADQERRLPAETVEDYKKSGMLRAFVPERFGGKDYDLELLVDLVLEIARGCGASGWLASFYSIHQFMVGWFDERAQEEYWSSAALPLAATVPGYRSQREVVDGGIRLTGRTSFSSGVDYADWVLYHTSEETCLIPRADFEIYDDWDVSGLRGTGSKGVVVENVFVPAHRIIPTEKLMNGIPPGAELYQDNPWYRIPNPVMFLLNQFVVAPVVGMARGVLDIFDERARVRMDAQVATPAMERPGPQLRFAEAAAEIETAEMFLRKNLSLAREAGQHRRILDLEERATFRRDVVYCAKLARTATNRLVDGMDSSALYEKNHLHRQARDLKAGSLQFLLHPEEAFINYSRVHWGLDPQSWLL
jgi:alkylation response protein AidB-like acyl-CoA dehydrogenase